MATKEELKAKFNRVSSDKSQLQQFVYDLIDGKIISGGDSSEIEINKDNPPSDIPQATNITVGGETYNIVDVQASTGRAVVFYEDGKLITRLANKVFDNLLIGNSQIINALSQMANVSIDDFSAVINETREETMGSGYVANFLAQLIQGGLLFGYLQISLISLGTNSTAISHADVLIDANFNFEISAVGGVYTNSDIRTKILGLDNGTPTGVLVVKLSALD